MVAVLVLLDGGRNQMELCWLFVTEINQLDELALNGEEEESPWLLQQLL